jgi:metal-responsive CopG/Arc/MetJ family transcriptional regulator
MRAVIDIPDGLVGQLDNLAEAEAVSRAEIMRRALGAWVQSHKPQQLERFYGLFENHPGARS